MIKNYRRVQDLYNWQDIARRTEKAYNYIYNKNGHSSIIGKLKCYLTYGTVVGIFAVFTVILEFIVFTLLDLGLLEWLVGIGGSKEEDIDIALDSCNFFKTYEVDEEKVN
jgi:hypothetical protein